MTVLDLLGFKKERRKISMVTCYDYSSARILSKTPIDIVLVGDSASMVMHGHSSTIPMTMDKMAVHVAAVARGATNKFIVADLPFMSFRKGLTENMEAAQLLMQAGAQAVKLEGLSGNEQLIRHLVGSGVPVIGHLGLTPQFIHLFGGFKVQGRNGEAAERIQAEAAGLEECGASAVVIECVPSALASEMSKRLTIPTIGIGAGPHCDGQVLVWQDLLGMNQEFKPRFVRNYMDGEKLIAEALSHFHSDVMEGQFPGDKESYS